MNGLSRITSGRWAPSRSGRPLVAVAGVVALAGCMQSPAILDRLNPLKPDGASPEVTRQSSDEVQAAKVEAESEVITTLLARDSILEAGSVYNDVARAALAASANASQAELRMARLRAEARSKNWLPTIGPSISLTSLGDLVAQILVEQVLFDNGRRKAEREFAAADVEVAAVNLSVDMNERVETALGLYITGLRGDEKAALSRRALSRMYEFERIVRGRVDGGVSDRSDLRVVQARINDIQSAMQTANEAATAARSELSAMTGKSFETFPETLTLDRPVSVEHLTVLLAMAEAKRDVAQAKIDRAGLLPSVTASANVSDGGTTGGITAGGAQIGFGTPAMLKAIAAAQDLADRNVAEAQENARRAVSRHQQRLASFNRQEQDAADLVRRSSETFNLFQAQFQAGQRSVMDVAAIYEELVNREQAHLDAKYEVILIQLEMARDLGLLADGDRI